MGIPGTGRRKRLAVIAFGLALLIASALIWLLRDSPYLAMAMSHLWPDRTSDAAAARQVKDNPAGAELGAAKFSSAGQLLRPADLDRWVFMGASVGLGYSQAQFDPKQPGMFQVVSMEPTAYAHFQTHGEYADGTMFLLSFYATKSNETSAESGLSQGDLESFEIHLIDKGLFEDGRAFYPFGKDDAQVSALPPNNACVQCHIQRGVFDGTFVQFYPIMREQIPEPLRRDSKVSP